MAAGC